MPSNRIKQTIVPVVLVGVAVLLVLGSFLLPTRVTPFPELTLTAAIAHAQTSTTTQTTGNNIAFSCSDAQTCISSVVYLFTVGFMSALAYVGTIVFDIAVQFTLNSVPYSLQFLTQAWTSVRDVANMAFIFILVYIAFTVILRAETANTMRALAGVVVVALLLNFSFFFTRVVIDVGNVLAVQFYNAIPTTQTIANPVSGNTTKDLTANIMNSVGIQQTLSSDSFKQFQGNNGFLVQVIALSFIYILAGAMFAIIAFAFLTVGFKFVIRTVALWVVIIAAPLAFAAGALAVTKNKTASRIFETWKGALFQFSFYPAIFLFVFIIINQIVSGIAATSSGGLIGAALGATNTAASSSPLAAIAIVIANVGIRLGFVVILLYFGMKAADFVSDAGTAQASQASNWVGRKIGGATYGLAGAGLRTALAPARQAVAQNLSVQTAAKQRGLNLAGLQGFGARTLQRAVNGSYDVRDIPGVRKGVQDLAGGSGMHGGDIGRGPTRTQLQRNRQRTAVTRAPQNPSPTTTISSVGQRLANAVRRQQAVVSSGQQAVVSSGQQAVVSSGQQAAVSSGQQQALPQAAQNTEDLSKNVAATQGATAFAPGGRFAPTASVPAQPAPAQPSMQTPPAAPSTNVAGTQGATVFAPGGRFAPAAAAPTPTQSQQAAPATTPQVQPVATAPSTAPVSGSRSDSLRVRLPLATRSSSTPSAPAEKPVSASTQTAHAQSQNSLLQAGQSEEPAQVSLHRRSIAALARAIGKEVSANQSAQNNVTIHRTEPATFSGAAEQRISRIPLDVHVSEPPHPTTIPGHITPTPQTSAAAAAKPAATPTIPTPPPQTPITTPPHAA